MKFYPSLQNMHLEILSLTLMLTCLNLSKALNVGLGAPILRVSSFVLSPFLCISFWPSIRSRCAHSFPKQGPCINSPASNIYSYYLLLLYLPWLTPICPQASHRMSLFREVLLNPTPIPKSNSSIKTPLKRLHFFLTQYI